MTGPLYTPSSKQDGALLICHHHPTNHDDPHTPKFFVVQVDLWRGAHVIALEAC